MLCPYTIPVSYTHLDVYKRQVQSNSIGAAFSNAFHIPALVVGFFVAAVSAFIFIGGVKRIASVTEKLVPVMAVFYLSLIHI